MMISNSVTNFVCHSKYGGSSWGLYSRLMASPVDLQDRSTVRGRLAGASLCKTRALLDVLHSALQTLAGALRRGVQIHQVATHLDGVPRFGGV